MGFSRLERPCLFTILDSILLVLSHRKSAVLKIIVLVIIKRQVVLK